MAPCDESASLPPVDILVRTSGVKRLSDFLLWQVSSTVPVLCLPDMLTDGRYPKLNRQCCEGTQLQFISTLWPACGLWDVFPVILDYQRKKMGKH